MSKDVAFIRRNGRVIPIKKKTNDALASTAIVSGIGVSALSGHIASSQFKQSYRAYGHSAHLRGISKIHKAIKSDFYKTATSFFIKHNIEFDSAAIDKFVSDISFEINHHLKLDCYRLIFYCDFLIYCFHSQEGGGQLEETLWDIYEPTVPIQVGCLEKENATIGEAG